jgi:Tc5 transposase DNA-binding domain
VSISSLGEFVSAKYDALDNPNVTVASNQYRQRDAAYPDLEAALYQFQVRMTQKGAAITGEILQEMANKIWDRLPQYSALDRPKFSYGWLHKFKQRHNIRQQIRHGEAAQINRKALEEDLKELRLVCNEYQLQDIYNMDETGLF